MTSRKKRDFCIRFIALAVGSISLLLSHQPVIRQVDQWFQLQALPLVSEEPFLIDSSEGKLQLIPLDGHSKIVPAPIFITDDPLEIFESQPPSATDLSLILDELHQHGHRSFATNQTLLWPQASPFALGLFEESLGKFDHSLIGLSLSRSATPEDLPSAFLTSTVPLTQIDGSYDSLPRANRLTFPESHLGNQNTALAFSSLDNETVGDSAFLLALWGDRIVFSFDLLQLIQIENVALDNIQIIPGKAIRLGSSHIIVPIDDFGRLRLTGFLDPPLASSISIKAEDLVSPPEEGFTYPHESTQTALITPLDDPALSQFQALLAYSQFPGKPEDLPAISKPATLGLIFLGSILLSSFVFLPTNRWKILACFCMIPLTVAAYLLSLQAAFTPSAFSLAITLIVGLCCPLDLTRATHDTD